MIYLQSIITVFSIFVVVSVLIAVDSNEAPRFLNLAPVESFKGWMGEWKGANLDPVAQDVNDAYDNFSGLVSAYRDALTGIDVATFSNVSGMVQTN